jgi:hypothetical protein
MLSHIDKVGNYDSLCDKCGNGFCGKNGGRGVLCGVVCAVWVAFFAGETLFQLFVNGLGTGDALRGGYFISLFYIA